MGSEDTVHKKGDPATWTNKKFQRSHKKHFSYTAQCRLLRGVKCNGIAELCYYAQHHSYWFYSMF